MNYWKLFRSCTVMIDGGSGCIVKNDGDDCYIFTAKHLVEGKELKQIKITGYKDDEYWADIVYLHKNADAAILHIMNKGLKGVKAIDVIPEYGQEFILYGYPEHRRVDRNQTEELSNLSGKVTDFIEKNCEVVGQTDNFTLLRFALGFSGGGVFFFKNDTLLLIGIQSKMDSDAPGRIRFVSISAFQEIIKTFNLKISIPKEISEVNEKIMDFTVLMERVTEDFFGRDWLKEKIDDKLKNWDRGYIQIIALPGVGKTAFAAKLVQERDWIHHFNSCTYGIVSYKTFLSNIYTQINLRFGSSCPDPTDDNLKNGLYFEKLLDDLGNKLTKDGKRITIIIDALDERERTTTGVPLFLPKNLPPGIRIIVLTRPDTDSMLYLNEPREDISIDPADPLNIDDIRRFLKNVIPRDFSRQISESNLNESLFIDNLLKASEGNFMYVRTVLNDIKYKTGAISDIRSLPPGLSGYYESHWKLLQNRLLLKGNDEWIFYKILQILSLTDSSVSYSIDDICRILHFAERNFTNDIYPAVDRFIESILQFLYFDPLVKPRKYRIYHTSFKDFLADKSVLNRKEEIETLNKWIGEFKLERFMKEQNNGG